MKKNDMLLFGGVILLAAVTLLLYALFSKKGSCVLVLRDGVETERYLLSEDIEVEIKTEYGTNHLKIENGYASVTEADCPDKLCVHQKKISKSGESLICLPHRLVIQVESEEKTDTDAVAG